MLILMGVGLLFNSTPAQAILAAGRATPDVPTVFAAPANYIVHGAHINPVSTYPQEVSNFETSVGKNIGIIMYFFGWTRMTEGSNGAGPCDDGFLPGMAFAGSHFKPGDTGGRAVMITWEPLPQPNIQNIGSPGPSAYDNILSGQFDTLIDTCADELKAWSNKTFLMRFMHEMNIADATWWAGQPYNLKPDGTGDTDKYKQVWRYVWQRFKDKGVKNVEWVWSPNYASNPNFAWNDMNNYYPGDQYVDWIGLSGYNWMGAIPFQSYSDLYNAALTDLQCRYAKPIMNAEMGSAPYSNGNDNPSSQEGWVADAYQRAQTFPLVRAVVWYNDFSGNNLGGTDFRIWYTPNGYLTTPPGLVDPGVTNAYKNAVSASAFTSSFNSTQLLNPPMTRCPGDAVSGNGVLSARPMSAIVARTGATTASFSIGAFGLGTDTVFTIRGCPHGAICHFASSDGTRSANRPAPWSGDTLIVTASSDTPLGPFTLTISGGGTSVQIQLTVLQSIQHIFIPAVQN